MAADAVNPLHPLRRCRLRVVRAEASVRASVREVGADAVPLAAVAESAWVAAVVAFAVVEAVVEEECEAGEAGTPVAVEVADAAASVIASV